MEHNLTEAFKAFNIKFDAESEVFNGTGSYIVPNPIQSYSARYRGEWFKPEYNFNDIQRAQDSDSYIAKSIEKKSVKFLLAGYELSGENPKTVEYIKKRLKQLEIASDCPINIMFLMAAQDLFRYNNHVWVIVRNENNSGGKSYKKGNKTIKPISGIFPIPFETCEFRTKDNGKLEKIRQVVPGATKQPEFLAENIIHFYMNKRPGFIVGSPTMFAALEDVLLLRRIEENVEELIESNLFPLFHYKIGTKEAPERVNQKTGLREAEEISQVLKFMPSSGVYISDWRHEITAVGSEGKALRMDYYLEYFKKRVFSALGVSPVDMGESDSSNRSTAQTQSKSLTEAVESMQALMKTFIDYYLIQPLLMESNFSFDPLSPENIVEINFNKIDVSEQMQVEQNANQLFQANAITHEELRQKIGKRPMKQEAEKTLNYNKFPSKVDEAKIESLKAGSAGSNTAQNQYGTSAKKTSSKKDEEEISYLLKNDLYEKWIILLNLISDCTDEQKIEQFSLWEKDFQERLYSILFNYTINAYIDIGKKIDTSLISDESYSLHAKIIEYSSNATKNLIQNLNVKIDKLHNDGISLETIFDSCAWRIEEIQDRVFKYYSSILETKEINTNILFMEE